MADKSKYYYLKIKENFFDTEDMKLLESMDNGYLYSNILMKMYLLSLKNGGKLVYKDKIPYNSKMLSTILNHNVDILDKAIKIFQELNMIEILESGEIFMLDIQNYIGKSSDEADRIRKYRNEIQCEKQKQLSVSETNVVQMYNKCTTNLSNIKDKDKDIIKDKDKDITIYQYIEQNFGRPLAPLEFEKINNWLSSLSFEENDIEKIIRYAISVAVMNGKRTFNYVNGILNNWMGKNFKTYADIIENERPTRNENDNVEFSEIFDYDWLNDEE